MIYYIKESKRKIPHPKKPIMKHIYNHIHQIHKLGCVIATITNSQIQQ